MLHYLGPLERVCSIILVHLGEDVPRSWSTGGRVFYNLGPLEGACSIILVHWWGRAFHNVGPWRVGLP